MWVVMGVEMKRKLHRLDTKWVQNQKRSGYWCDGGGLYLQVNRDTYQELDLPFHVAGRGHPEDRPV